MPTLENDQQQAVAEPSLVQDHQQDDIYYEMPSAVSSSERRNNNNGNNNNNHHVVPVGVLIVLFTLYLTTAAVKRNYALRDAAEINLQQHVTAVVSKPVQNEPQTTLTIRERFLEYDNVCMDLAIFTKDVDISKHCTVVINTQSSAEKIKDRLQLMRGKGSVPHKRKHGSGHRYNKSTWKSKTHTKKMETTIANSNKKEQQAKKNTTAEPIIYLFALVFIYLLLKAASDINQHYKSQAKGDKRLRRCSLQSYAQTHKQDRRASKDSPLQPIHEPQHLQHDLKQRLMEFRSKSVDRCINPAVQCDYLAKNADIFAHLRKYTSVDETNAHGLHLRKPLGGEFAAENVFSTSMNRRCSVPVSLIPQGSKIISTMHMVPSLSSSPRRISIASGSIGLPGGVVGSGGLEFQGGADAQFPEIKRRIRMINRH